ncbi:hypothetical protein PVAP13_3KG125900 [Panicum virgatum]|uniref:Uncharacterized protein n=1 Tax=Panicum virgatum TaxID=38727 RepID=A0A8T0UQJ6_PANVG|nr:hypothetical protein PVAP13_3KG125900 [Panicum virgatum]
MSARPATISSGRHRGLGWLCLPTTTSPPLSALAGAYAEQLRPAARVPGSSIRHGAVLHPPTGRPLMLQRIVHPQLLSPLLDESIS